MDGARETGEDGRDGPRGARLRRRCWRRAPAEAQRAQALEAAAAALWDAAGGGAARANAQDMADGARASGLRRGDAGPAGAGPKGAAVGAIVGAVCARSRPISPTRWVEAIADWTVPSGLRIQPGAHADRRDR
ncbi:MAG: hypothetical protein KatS3mg118_2998 [Paracoccaceae bacterium]|nr:MAG: hypothetical protein KatS3mg118_2998 [Paracoccaceae bacterium]